MWEKKKSKTGEVFFIKFQLKTLARFFFFIIMIIILFYSTYDEIN